MLLIVSAVAFKETKTGSILLVAMKYRLKAESDFRRALSIEVGVVDSQGP